jgi:xanthine dehydrogenase small subunit
MSIRKNIIRFILDGKIVEVVFSKESGISPDISLLRYLRKAGYKSVKEGCGEGDCGACTVVIAEACDGKPVYKAINSCLVLLPMIHGCQVITADSLPENKDGQFVLHPVQKALVDHHGSQCGYCTPGMVMSMFALWKSVQYPTESIIKRRLAGNLCRCTGYQPIIDASKQFPVAAHRQDQFSDQAKETVRSLELIKKEIPSLDIKASGIRYFRPATMKEALQIRRNFPAAVVINGATDVAVQLNKHKIKISSYLDLSGLIELKYTRLQDDSIEFGSCIPIEEMGVALKSKFPALHEMINVFGSHQIRNLATPGGNIGSASPIGDLLPVMIAASASIELQNESKKRIMLLEEFITGYHETRMKPDELITKIIIPLPTDATLIRSYKISKRKDVDISTVSAGFCFELDQKDKIQSVKLVFGGMAAMPVRASAAEKYLLHKSLTRKSIREAAEIVYAEFNPISDARASAESRRLLARNLLISLGEDYNK